MRGPAGLVASVLVLAVLSVGAPAAFAAFPGTNGPVVVAGTPGFGFGPGVRCPGRRAGALLLIQPGSARPTVLVCGPGRDAHPFVSPNGSEVVFSSSVNGGPSHLYTVPLGASGHVTATSVSDSSTASDDYPSWSPTGDGTIVFQRTLPGAGSSPQLYTENVTDPGSALPVFSSPTGFSDTEPVFDPSNPQLLVFVRVVAGHSHIFSYNLSTQTLTDLSARGNGGGTGNDAKPDFSPAGTAGLIVFQSNRACNSMQLYTMTVQGTDQEPVFQSTGTGGAVTQQCRTSSQNPVFSPLGNALAFDQGGFFGFTGGPYTVSVSSSGVATGRVTSMTRSLFGFSGQDDEPNWGPSSSPPPQAPEVGLPILLPVVALSALAVGLLVTRRRRTRPVGP